MKEDKIELDLRIHATALTINVEEKNRLILAAKHIAMLNNRIEILEIETKSKDYEKLYIETLDELNKCRCNDDYLRVVISNLNLKIEELSKLLVKQ